MRTASRHSRSCARSPEPQGMARPTALERPSSWPHDPVGVVRRHQFLAGSRVYDRIARLTASARVAHGVVDLESSLGGVAVAIDPDGTGRAPGRWPVRRMSSRKRWRSVPVRPDPEPCARSSRRSPRRGSTRSRWGTDAVWGTIRGIARCVSVSSICGRASPSTARSGGRARRYPDRHLNHMMSRADRSAAGPVPRWLSPSHRDHLRPVTASMILRPSFPGAGASSHLCSSLVNSQSPNRLSQPSSR